MKNKGLEAFNDVKQLVATIEFAGKKDKAVANEELNIIEQELKDYYSLREDIKKCSCWKEHKALDVMKKYKHFQSFFAFNPTYKDYQANMSIYEDEELMSEEEYNLLREVL